MNVSPGDVVGGRYVVEEVLGAGGMGVVVAARHEALGHRVAMKLVSASMSADAEAFVRFSREARRFGGRRDPRSGSAPALSVWSLFEPRRSASRV